MENVVAHSRTVMPLDRAGLGHRRGSLTGFRRAVEVENERETGLTRRSSGVGDDDVAGKRTIRGQAVGKSNIKELTRGWGLAIFRGQKPLKMGLFYFVQLAPRRSSCMKFPALGPFRRVAGTGIG
jgi:hypothetical protein